jgi:hypothetical protein
MPNFSMVALEEILGKCLVTHTLWPPRSPDLNTRNYYLLGTLKDRVYMNNPHQLQEVKDYIHGEIQSILKRSIMCQEMFLEGARPA